MALSLGAGVPWVMCKQVDAPDDIVSFLLMHLYLPLLKLIFTGNYTEEYTNRVATFRFDGWFKRTKMPL